MNYSNQISRLSSVMALTIFSSLFALSCGSAGNTLLTNARNPLGAGPAPVILTTSGGAVAAGDLGASGNYVIMAKTGVTNVTASTITGNMGVSPVPASYITGFSLVADSTNVFSTSTTAPTSVIGKIYAAWSV